VDAPALLLGQPVQDSKDAVVDRRPLGVVGDGAAGRSDQGPVRVFVVDGS
jgi:hypothetical protein